MLLKLRPSAPTEKESALVFHNVCWRTLCAKVKVTQRNRLPSDKGITRKHTVINILILESENIRELKQSPQKMHCVVLVISILFTAAVCVLLKLDSDIYIISGLLAPGCFIKTAMVLDAS